MACLENPIKLYFYWNSPIRYDHGGIPYFGGRAQKHWIIKQKIQHSELVDKICHLRGIDKSVVRVTITLRHPTILKGSSVVQYFLIELDDDDAMDLLWHMPDEFKLVGVQVLVEFEDITTTHTETCTVQPSNGPSISPNITPTVNLGSFTSLLTDDWPLHSPPFETEAGRVETDEDDPNQTLDADGYPSSEGPNEDELHVDEDDGDEIDEEIFVPSSQNLNCGHTSNFGSRISDPCSNVSINMQRWSEDNFELRLGMRFIDKVQATYAVRKWSVVQGREFTVVKSKSKIWTAECKNKTREHPCNWYIRIISRQSHGEWEITVLNHEHTCIVRFVNNNHRNLTHRYIARHITHLIRNDPELHVSAVKQEVQKLFQSGCSYRKGWYARKAAIELLYGSWNDTFTILPKYMQALEQANPGTILLWKHHESSSVNQNIFHYMFWSFKSSILGFNYCRPVICVDGTFLRGPYKGVLLVASGWDANNHVFPLAFALVDEESTSSWDWFLRLLRHHVVPEKFVCLISDRHKGILSSVSRQIEWQQPNAVHRFCLRHVRANFKVKFKKNELTELMYKAGITCKVHKFTELMEEIKRRNVEAYNYLKDIDPQKWTLAYDGGYRYGCMTTNLSESLNSVLKKCRALPLKALVEFIYDKLVQYFCQRREEASHTRHLFPSTIWKKYTKNEKKSRGHTVVQYNVDTGIFSVRSPARGDGRGNMFYTVNFIDQSCSCHKWSVFGLPCSHVFAVCRHRGLDSTTFVLNTYSKQNYKMAYEANLYPVASEDLWTDVSFSLQYYKPNMKGGQPGRLRTTRYRCSMDARDPNSPPRCGNCHVSGHNRRTCPNISRRTKED